MKTFVDIYYHKKLGYKTIMTADGQTVKVQKDTLQLSTRPYRQSYDRRCRL